MKNCSLPGPLSYLWLNEYKDKGSAKSFTREKIAYLPSLMDDYKEIIQKLKILGMTWIQLEDPIFITDISEEYQDNIIQAYQDLLVDAPKIMLATYFGGIEENINWIKEIPIQGLHIDLDSSPEQIMFVLKNDIMSTLEVISLGGIQQSDSQFDAIKNFISRLDSVRVNKIEIWLRQSNSKKNDFFTTRSAKKNRVIDLVQLYINLQHLSQDNAPRILQLKNKIEQLKQKNNSKKQINCSIKNIKELTCFLKKRDQVELIKDFNILARAGGL